jgi:glutaconate CoA-transferase subunit A
VVERQPEIRTVRSPYDDGAELVAMPALPLDVALVHQNRADARGNAQFLGPDLYFDDLFLAAAAPGRRFVSCEQVVDTAALLQHGPVQSLRVPRMVVDGVIEAPGGAHFTSCVPDYDRDEAFQREYAAAAADPDAWKAFSRRYLECENETEYQKAVAAP